MNIIKNARLMIESIRRFDLLTPSVREQYFDPALYELHQDYWESDDHSLFSKWILRARFVSLFLCCLFESVSRISVSHPGMTARHSGASDVTYSRNVKLLSVLNLVITLVAVAALTNDIAAHRAAREAKKVELRLAEVVQRATQKLREQDRAASIRMAQRLGIIKLRLPKAAD